MDLHAIPLQEIPADGLRLEGRIDANVFELNPADARPTGPLTYELELRREGDFVLASGWIEAEFDRECVRCLGPFRQRVRLDPYAADIDPEGKPTINLTDRLREDILLDLPAYPRCEEGIDPRECPAGDRFQSASDPEADARGSDHPSPPGLWDALDGWQPREP